MRIVYSPLDALALAEGQPDREVAFFAVGFETTGPANAMVAATSCGVALVTGDTKVVDRGKADGLFINTTGVGLVPAIGGQEFRSRRQQTVGMQPRTGYRRGDEPD